MNYRQQFKGTLKSVKQLFAISLPESSSLVSSFSEPENVMNVEPEIFSLLLPICQKSKNTVKPETTWLKTPKTQPTCRLTLGLKEERFPQIHCLYRMK